MCRDCRLKHVPAILPIPTTSSCSEARSSVSSRDHCQCQWHWQISVRAALALIVLMLSALVLPAHAQACASYSLSSTNSAQTNYQLCTLVLNGGYTYTFTTCGTSGTTDTFIRLWDAADKVVRAKINLNGCISVYRCMFGTDVTAS